MATQSGTDLIFSDPYTDTFYVYLTQEGRLGELGKADYYMMNGDIDGVLVMCEDFAIKKAAIDTGHEQYSPGTETLAKGTNMNIAGERVYYIKYGGDSVDWFQ